MVEILEKYLIQESNSKEEVIRKSKRANNYQTDFTSKTKSSPVQEQTRVSTEIDVHAE